MCLFNCLGKKNIYIVHKGFIKAAEFFYYLETETKAAR